MTGLTMAAVAVLLAGCGGYEPDMAKIEKDIAAEISEQEDLEDVTLECPSEVTWKPGSDFHCTGDAMFLLADSFRVTVSMENDKGEYTWKVDD